MDEAQLSFVKYECTDRIATITLNRPEKLNAVNDVMVKEIETSLRRFDMDDDAHIAIICGSGRAYCTGADVRARQMKSKDELTRGGGPEAPDARSSELLTRSVNWKPVISAVHGYALGLGVGLALDSDLLVAEAGTRFQITETPRGLAGSGKLMNIMSYRGLGSFAAEVTLTGRFFTAEEAHAAGVVDRLAPAGQHMEVARELAFAVIANPPLSVRASVMLRRWEIADRKKEALRYASLNKLYLSEDFAEAARAFVEKRPAKPFKAR